MGKRGATQAAGAKAKAPRPGPVAELLAVANLTDSCHDMLAAMAPFSLKDGERHQYQEQMNSVLATIFGGLEADRKAAAAAAEDAVAAHEKDREGSVQAVETASAKEASEMVVRDAKATASAEAEAAVEAAKEALEGAKASVANFADEQKAVVEEKAEYEALAGEKMAQLKEGNFPGKLWRERDRVIGEVAKALETLSPDEASLRGAFAAAMKTKAGARGAFAEKAVEYTDGMLAKHIAALGEKISNGEAEAAARAAAVTAAEQALEQAVAAKDAAQEAYIAADNTLLEATEAKRLAEEELENYTPRMDELAGALATAKADLETTQALVAQFERLRTGAPAEEEKPVEEEAMAVEEVPAA